MSQSGSYQYQTAYVNSNNSLKSGMLHLMNNQPNTVQHIQNGMQSPHSNFTGTPSSQSSRDPSRETSRDPSPTQYLHNQYRQQLPRPPIPPINGQQGINPNVGASSLPITQTHKYSPPTIPYVHTQFGSTNAVSSSNTANTASAFASLSSNVQMNQNSNVQTVSPGTQGPLLNSNHNTLSDPHVIGRVVSSSFTGIKPTVTGTEQSYRWASNFGSTTNIGNTLIMSTSTDNLSNQSQRSGPIQVPSSQCLGQSSSVTPIFTPNKQNESQNVPMISQNQAAAPSAINPSYSSENTKHLSLNTGSLQSQSQNASSESQTADVVTPQNIPSHSSQPKYGNQQNAFNIAQHTQNSPNTISPFMHSTNSSTQNLFLYSQQNQLPSQSPNLSGSQNIINAQEYHPKELKPQVPYLQQSPTQNILGSHTDSHGLGLGLNQNQIAYNTQQNLASQRNYSQNLYGTQLPPNTANMLNPGMVPPRIGEPLTSPSQLPPKQVSNMPPFPGQQLQNQYDARSQFSGQMSNIPLDSMTKRYPSSYPEQMNQLNNQMNNMSVTQSGFNKIWGMESIDLLQCRNILPSEKIESPKIKLHQEFLDSINCSPECTLTKIPESNSLLQKSRLPLGILIHPFKDLNHLPVIQCSTIVRCRACRTYINPFVYFVDSKRWKCNLCYRINDLPEEFQFDPVTKSYGDPSRRPEVKTSTIEFIAPSEYMLRPPQPAVYLFILDVSRLAVDTGYLSITCNVISEKLTRLPGDGRTQVGFLAIDSAIHFFSMPDNVSQPHEMIMLDVDDVFLPCPDNLIVNLKEREELIKDLLVQLPTKFQNTHDTNCALGAGLQAAYKLMSPTGGRITVFQTCLPNLGPGVLQAREDPNSRTNKDVPHLNPATDFYKRLALDCSGQQIAVDLFLLNSQYSDLATLSGMCKFSGGCIYHIPLFRASKLQSRETLDRILRRYLTRKIGFEAVMRIRCTRGLSIHTFHGNFFVRSTDLLSLPNINPDAGFGMQISIEENLSDVQNVCFQAALLYTSSKGERRIRVHTLCLPIVTSLTDVLFSADQQCIIGLLSKMAVDRSQQSSLSDARDALINVAIDVLSVYKMSQSIASGGLLAPSSLKLLPLYIISLLKCIAFRSGTNTRLDDRVYAMCQLKTLPLFQLIQMVYPDLYPVHTFDDRNSKDIDGKICPQPPRLHLSAAKLDSRGVFLMDAGDKILIYVGKNIHPSFCCNVLGVSAFATIPEEFYELPEFDNIESEKFRNFVFSLQEEKPFYASIQIIRDDSHFRTLFVERLIEDRSESALSYHEFLQHLKTQVK